MDQSTVLIFGILAGVIQFAGYYIYAYDVFRSGVRPNPASWLIWSYGNALVCLSYIFLNLELSPAIDILPIVCAVTCIIMTILFFFYGKFRPLEKFEKTIVAIDIVVTILWALSDFVGLHLVPLSFLHIVLLVSALISFVPLYVEVMRDHQAEKPRAWVVWTIAYMILLIIVLAESISFEAFSYPLLYVVLHATVVVLASKRLRGVRDRLRIKLS